MSSDEQIQSLWTHISHSIDRIVSCLDGLPEEDLNWKPLESANSLYALAIHMMANAADNILGLVGGQAIRRDREAEFRTQGTSAEAASTQWKDLKARISSTLGNLSDEALAEKYEHRRRGRLTGFEIMVTVARHAAEHVGHAELTLDLLAAARGRPPVPRDVFGMPVRR